MSLESIRGYPLFRELEDSKRLNMSEQLYLEVGVIWWDSTAQICCICVFDFHFCVPGHSFPGWWVALLAFDILFFLACFYTLRQ